MATKVKPQRIDANNSPSVWQVPSYVDDQNFAWITPWLSGQPAIIAWATNTAHTWATNISWNSVNVVLDTIVSNITWTLTFGIGWWNSSKSFFIRKNWITVIWPANGSVSWSTSVVPWDTIEFMYSSNFSDWSFNLTWSTTFDFDYTTYFS